MIGHDHTIARASDMAPTTTSISRSSFVMLLTPINPVPRYQSCSSDLLFHSSSNDEVVFCF